MLSADMLADGMRDLNAPLQRLATSVNCLREKAKKRGVWAATGAVDPLRITLLFFARYPCENACPVEGACHQTRNGNRPPHRSAAIAAKRFIARNELIEQLAPEKEIPALPCYDRPVSVLPMHEALFSATRRLPLKKCAGRVAAFPLVSDPPGVPLVMPGEVIPQNIIENSGGITQCFV
jgi:hypothetical protein